MNRLLGMRRTTGAAVAAVLLAAPAVMIAGAGPAAAVDGSVSSHYTGMGGGGSTAKAYVDFTGSYSVSWKNIYVNDTCPGDGKWAILKFEVRYEGTSAWTTVGTRKDKGGCTSPVYKESLATWKSSRRINDATVVACVQGKGCASPGSSYRDNPYWGKS